MPKQTFVVNTHTAAEVAAVPVSWCRMVQCEKGLTSPCTGGPCLGGPCPGEPCPEM